MDIGTLILIVAIVLGLIIFVKTVRIVPQKEAFIVERLGKYNSTLEAGFHILVPFIDRIAYKQTLKEQAIDVPPQQCITKDNIAVEVDGVLYMQVVDPSKASYGITNYKFATTQLAQTTLRSAVGKMELEKTFEERDLINSVVIAAVDKASDPWGIKVTRYEVKNILPPNRSRMPWRRRCGRCEKRALIAESEGDRQAKINRADGDRQEAIFRSEGEKQKRINESEGRAFEIERVAQATSEGIRKVASALSDKGGIQAVNLRIAEQYLGEFGKLAKTNNTMIIPSDLANIAGIVKAASSVLTETKSA